MTPFEARRALQRAFLRLERAIVSLRRAERLAGFESPASVATDRSLSLSDMVNRPGTHSIPKT